MQVLRGLLGIALILAVCFLLSRNRRAVSPRIVICGLALQLLLGLLVFRTDSGRSVFQGVTDLAYRFFSFSYQGSSFVFGPLGREPGPGRDFALAFQALPIVIYFSAVMAVLYHLGIMQVVVYALARLLGKLLRVSGAESMAVTAEIVLGMTESPLVVRPYLEKMTTSELMALLTAGFATVAGTVLGVYMSFVGERYAVYLIVASVMGAPASLVIAKILVPETGEPVTGAGCRLVFEKRGTNLLDAIAIGVRDGLHLALNIAAMLIAFYALMALLNWPLGAWFGTSLEAILGLLLSPLAWCLGADWSDAANFGSLLGTKIITNEWIAYQKLQSFIQDGAMSERSIKIATFALCGFANFGSIGVALGGIGQLAPSRREDLARLALLAMVAGALSSCLTGAIAGMFA